MFLVDVSAPHALSINTGVGPSAEGATESGFFSFGPSFLEILFSGRAPATRRFELRRVTDCTRDAVYGSDVVCGIKKPFWICGHEIVIEAIHVLVGIWEVDEGGVDEDGAGIRGRRVQSRQLGDDERSLSDGGGSAMGGW